MLRFALAYTSNVVIIIYALALPFDVVYGKLW